MEIWQREGGTLKRSGTTGTPQQHTKPRPRQTLNSRQLQASFPTCRSCLIQSNAGSSRPTRTKHAPSHWTHLPIRKAGKGHVMLKLWRASELPDSGPASLQHFHCDCDSSRRVCENNTQKLGSVQVGACYLRPFHRVRERKWSGVRHRRRAVPNSDTKTSLLLAPSPRLPLLSAETSRFHGEIDGCTPLNLRASFGCNGRPGEDSLDGRGWKWNAHHRPEEGHLVLDSPATPPRPPFFFLEVDGGFHSPMEQHPHPQRHDWKTR
jgi:hypothetical protein